MFGGRSWRLARIAGVEIRIDSSWTIIALLVTYSLFLQFRVAFGDLTVAPAIALAVLAAALFFGSVLTHEMAHALVALSRGIEVRGITLFLFGGATHTKAESRGPGEEFVISVVGPVTSILLGALFWLVAVFGDGFLPDEMAGAFGYLGWVNLLLAVFNLVPGFPLDGGRILRSAVWKATGSLARATRVASISGQTVGYLLVAGGVLLVSSGRISGGIWFAAIGWFLAQAARMSYEEIRLQQLLEGVDAQQVMDRGVEPGDVSSEGRAAVDPTTPMEEVVDTLRRPKVQRVVVVSDGQVLGIITSAGVAGWLARRQEARG